MEQAHILPKLRLGVKKEKGGVDPTGPHRVKMVADRIGKGVDRETGKVIDVVKYTVEEEGELKEYSVPVKARETGELHYLVQRLSEVSEGEEVILEMKKRGFKNYVDVLNLNGEPIGVNEEGVSEPEEEGEEPEDAPEGDAPDKPPFPDSSFPAGGSGEEEPADDRMALTEDQIPTDF